MTIFYFVFKRFFRNIINIVLFCLLPILVVILPANEWSSIPVGYQYYGILLMYVAARQVEIIMEDRTKGTLKRIVVAPITPFQYLFQNLCAYSLLMIAQIAIVILGGILIHGFDWIMSLQLFVVYATFSLTAISLSLAWFSIFRRKESAGLILLSVIMIIVMLGGLLWPIDFMPEFLQRLAMFMPTYWLAEGMQLIRESAPGVELIFPLVMMYLFTLIFLLVGSKRRIA